MNRKTNFWVHGSRPLNALSDANIINADLNLVQLDKSIHTIHTASISPEFNVDTIANSQCIMNELDITNMNPVSHFQPIISDANTSMNAQSGSQPLTSDANTTMNVQSERGDRINPMKEKKAHDFLSSNDRDEPLVSNLNNMPCQIAKDEAEIICLLRSLLTADGKSSIQVMVGGLLRHISTWHYVQANPLEVNLQTTNFRLEYMDFDDLSKRPELYKWQRIHALVVKSEDNDKASFSDRVFFSRRKWYHSIECADGKYILIKQDFIIVSLFRSRCQQKYLACTIGHIPSGKLFYLQYNNFTKFIRCGWCAREDNDFDMNDWERKEDQLLDSILYQEDLHVPIDVTRLDNIRTSRQVYPNSKEVYLKV